MNRDSYSVNHRYTGPRHHKKAPHTRKEDAISVRLYLNAKGNNGEKTTVSPHKANIINDLAMENIELRRRLNDVERAIGK